MSGKENEIQESLNNFLEFNLEKDEFNQVKNESFEEKIEIMLNMYEDLLLKYTALGIAYEEDVAKEKYLDFEEDVLKRFDDLDNDEEIDTRLIRTLAENYK